MERTVVVQKVRQKDRVAQRGTGRRYVTYSHACEACASCGRFGRRSSFTVRDDDASHVHRPFDASTPVGLVLTFPVYCFVPRASYVKPFHGSCISVSILSDRSVAISRTVDLEKWRAHIPLQHQHL